MKYDNVSHPKHYQFNSACHEVRDVISDRVLCLLEVYPQSGDMVYDYANAIKYLLRWMSKNGEEDLRKAKFCIDSMLRKVTQSKTSTHKSMECESSDVPEYIYAGWQDRSHVAIIGEN